MHCMRTTLDILEAAKEISACTRRTAGQVLSELARKALSSSGPTAKGKAAAPNGFEVMPADNRVITPELVRKLMDESEDA